MWRLSAARGDDCFSSLGLVSFVAGRRRGDATSWVMADLFGRRAHASESSYSRERDKEKLARLQEFLRKEGYHIPEKPAAAAYPALPTVDVLAEISAHSLPLGRVRVTQARHSLVHAHLTRARSPHTHTCVTSAACIHAAPPTPPSRRCTPSWAPPRPTRRCRCQRCRVSRRSSGDL